MKSDLLIDLPSSWTYASVMGNNSAVGGAETKVFNKGMLNDSSAHNMNCFKLQKGTEISKFLERNPGIEHFSSKTQIESLRAPANRKQIVVHQLTQS
jgi:hypothetical protein